MRAGGMPARLPASLSTRSACQGGCTHAAHPTFLHMLQPMHPSPHARFSKTPEWKKIAWRYLDWVCLVIVSVVVGGHARVEKPTELPGQHAGNSGFAGRPGPLPPLLPAKDPTLPAPGLCCSALQPLPARQTLRTRWHTPRRAPSMPASVSPLFQLPPSGINSPFSLLPLPPQLLRPFPPWCPALWPMSVPLARTLPPIALFNLPPHHLVHPSCWPLCVPPPCCPTDCSGSCECICGKLWEPGVDLLHTAGELLLPLCLLRLLSCASSPAPCWHGSRCAAAAR